MFNQLSDLTKSRLNYKIILIAITSLVLILLFLTQKRIFFLLTVTLASLITSLIIGFVQPMKIAGIELVTFSTILIGSLFSPLVGAFFGVSLLVMHMIVAQYHGGAYLVWTIPEYALIGILSGILTSVGMLVAMIIAVNLVNSLLTLVFYRENSGRHLIFSAGNAIFNIVLLLKFFTLITNLIA